MSVPDPVPPPRSHSRHASAPSADRVEQRLPLGRAAPGAPDGVLRWRGALLMGVLNVTPDSFSDGGQHLAPEAALARARALIDEGAGIVDVGGESTRPGAEPVAAAEEVRRVVPVVRALAAEGRALLSVDTMKPEVAAAALDAGAHLVNDVGGLRDPAMLALCAERRVPVVTMHMQGEPRTMQRAPRYDDVVAEVEAALLASAERARAAGVPGVVIDPGIGFGKRVAHNLALLRATARLAAHGYPLLVGASRKSLIDRLAGAPDPRARLPGTLALHLHAAAAGAAVLRVHDVAAHRQALAVQRALLTPDERDDGGAGGGRG